MITRHNTGTQLYDYLVSEKDFELITRNKISFEVVDYCSIQAEFKFITTENFSLSVIFYSEKKKFAEALNIQNVSDIYTLTPHRLLELYHKGLAEIVCMVSFKYSYFMSFQKCGDVIEAKNDWNVKHTIPVKDTLETFDQFIAYTLRYYNPLKDHEN